jgi:hypothetical protein
MAEEKDLLGVDAVRHVAMAYLSQFVNPKSLRTATINQLLSDLKTRGARICLNCMKAQPVSKFPPRKRGCFDCNPRSRVSKKSRRRPP